MTYLYETGTQCPPYLSKIRDLSILPNILHVRTPWWKLTLQHVAALFHQGVDDFYQQLMCDSRTLPSLAVEEIGRGILEYRKAIRQDLPFRLKRLHVWNVSGWTLVTRTGDAKMRLIKRLLRTGRFYYKKPDGTLKPIRSCTIIYQVFKLHTPKDC